MGPICPSQVAMRKHYHDPRFSRIAAELKWWIYDRKGMNLLGILSEIDRTPWMNLDAEEAAFEVAVRSAVQANIDTGSDPVASRRAWIHAWDRIAEHTRHLLFWTPGYTNEEHTR